MTAEERKRIAEEEELAIANQEQVAVEALFGLFDGVQDNPKSIIKAIVDNDLDLPQVEVHSVSLETTGNSVSKGVRVSSDPIEAVVPSVAVVPTKTTDPSVPIVPTETIVPYSVPEKSVVHEIPRQDIVPCQPRKIDEVAMNKEYDVVPEDNDERDKKEEKRAEMLRKKNSTTNTILNYTEKHLGGIAGTEKKKRKKASPEKSSIRNCRQKITHKNAPQKKQTGKSKINKNAMVSSKKKKVGL